LLEQDLGQVDLFKISGLLSLKVWFKTYQGSFNNCKLIFSNKYKFRPRESSNVLREHSRTMLEQREERLVREQELKEEKIRADKEETEYRRRIDKEEREEKRRRDELERLERIERTNLEKEERRRLARDEREDRMRNNAFM
jgi:hypothetical protein